MYLCTWESGEIGIIVPKNGQPIHGPVLGTFFVPGVCPSHGMDLGDYARVMIPVIDLFFMCELTPKDTIFTHPYFVGGFCFLRRILACGTYMSLILSKKREGKPSAPLIPKYTGWLLVPRSHSHNIML